MRVIIPILLLAIALLATACGGSTPPATTEPSPPPITTPVAITSDLPPAEMLQSKYLHFGRITTLDGLSNDQLRAVVQDNRGFMWFGTLAGLNRYDGASIKAYHYDPDDPNSLSNNIARALLVDRDGVLWIGTWNGGLNQYDWEKDHFIRYQHNPDDPHSLSNDTVRVVYEDRDGTIWVGTTVGLNKLDRESGQFTRYQHDPDDPDSLSNDVVWAVLQDSAGVLWVGTAGGLNRFNPDTETFIHYRHDPADSSSLGNDTVRSIYEDSSGVLWLGTEGGLGKLNPERTSFTRYQHDDDDPQSLSHNIINSVVEDQSGGLWIGTWGGGLDRFDRDSETFSHYRYDSDDPYSLVSNTIWHIYGGQQGMLWIATVAGVSFLDGNTKPFYHYRALPGSPDSLSDNSVWALYADQEGNVWVGPSSGGLNKFDRQTESFTHYLNKPTDPVNLSEDSITVIYRDGQGLIWIGTKGTGLIKYDPDTGDATRYMFDENDPHSLSHNSVVSICEDRTGILWIGTYGGGLNAFDRDTELFTHYQHNKADPNSLSDNVVTKVFEDQMGVMWVGTLTAGLNKFDRQTGTFTRYRQDVTDPRSLASDTVDTIYEDQAGNLWIGTGGGLDKFDRQNGRVIRNYSTKDGLPSDTIVAILEDEQGRLWLHTHTGLVRFDLRTESIRIYTVSDGLQSDSIHIYAAYSQSPSGEMFFGGPNGFNAFYPEEITDNLTPPSVLITDFQLTNKPVPIGGDSVLQKSILETDELVLSYLDDVFSFEFAALNFRAPEETRYKYKMEGFEEEWNEVDSTRRFATYTNLDPGEYVFRVIASNNDGVWNEEGASIKITITPPWWETAWFRIGMLVLVIGLLVGGYRRRVGTMEARSRELEIQVAERTQELQAANQAKSIFLANMSHELRTPLNAILGFTRLMTRDPEVTAQQQEKLTIINRSGEHLLDMVGDILSLSRIEAGRVELDEEPFDPRQMLEDIGEIFQSRAEGKGLGFHLELADDLPPYLLGDAGKLRQVLINLLDNAIKFTQEGEVGLRAGMGAMEKDPAMVMLRLKVEDSGPGIQQDNLDEIFETFIRFDLAPHTQRGTGLGLSISKSLVEMMGGEIAVESEVGQGSLFKVNIPLRLTDEGVAAPDDAPVSEVIGLKAGQVDWRILVVEDNQENLLLLTNLLTQAGFTLQEAENGEEAVAKFQEWRPHFIWMDVRMPVMDGYEATKKIRALPGGEKVRIVAVTASVLDEPRKEILAAGCDDVVLKPFRDHEIFDAMARELGVEYVYRERTEAPAQPEGIGLSAEMLAELPPELLQELSQATLALDREATLEVIERIEEHAPETGASLSALVGNFQMGRIRDLLGEMER